MAGGKRSQDTEEAQRTENVILVDIEGTTTSISFVKDTLFPYVREHLKDYVEKNWDNAEFKEDLAKLKEQAKKDETDKVEGLVSITSATPEEEKETLVKNVLWQMDNDRKTGALKQLQGHMWREAYNSGAVKGHVYDDVPKALEEWTSSGKKVYVYSSGSVEAQKLLFGHSSHGDLLKYFTDYFDTEVGAKQEAASYKNILSKINVEASQVLFLTDVVNEAKAAIEAGLSSLILLREGNAALSTEEKSTYTTVETFLDISFQAPTKRQKVEEKTATAPEKEGEKEEKKEEKEEQKKTEAPAEDVEMADVSDKKPSEEAKTEPDAAKKPAEESEPAKETPKAPEISETPPETEKPTEEPKKSEEPEKMEVEKAEKAKETEKTAEKPAETQPAAEKSVEKPVEKSEEKKTETVTEKSAEAKVEEKPAAEEAKAEEKSSEPEEKKAEAEEKPTSEPTKTEESTKPVEEKAKEKSSEAQEAVKPEEKTEKEENKEEKEVKQNGEAAKVEKDSIEETKVAKPEVNGASKKEKEEEDVKDSVENKENIKEVVEDEKKDQKEKDNKEDNEKKEVIKEDSEKKVNGNSETEESHRNRSTNDDNNTKNGDNADDKDTIKVKKVVDSIVDGATAEPEVVPPVAVVAATS